MCFKNIKWKLKGKPLCENDGFLKKKKRFIEYYFKYIVYVYLRLKPNKFIMCFKNINQKLKKTPFCVYVWSLLFYAMYDGICNVSCW